MKIKFTLTIKESTVKKAEAFAKATNKNLLELVEHYLETLSKKELTTFRVNELAEMVNSRRESAPIISPDINLRVLIDATHDRGL